MRLMWGLAEEEEILCDSYRDSRKERRMYAIGVGISGKERKPYAADL